MNVKQTCRENYPNCADCPANGEGCIPSHPAYKNYQCPRCELELTPKDIIYTAASGNHVYKCKGCDNLIGTAALKEIEMLEEASR